MERYKFFSSYNTRSFAAKDFTLSGVPGWTFRWISTKDPWAMRGDPRMRFHLVCIPNDKTKDLIVLRNFAWYKGGYDQAQNSRRQWYLVTLTAGESSNGRGVDKEYEPYSGDLRYDEDHLNCYLNGKKDWSTQAQEKLEKAASGYPRNTKMSEIKQNLS